MLDNPGSQRLAFPAGAALPPSGGGEAGDLDVRRLWKAIVRRRFLLLAIWLGVALAVIAVTLATPKKYTTSVKLIAGGSSEQTDSGAVAEGTTNLPILNALLASNGAKTPETFAELVQQSPIVEEVIRQTRIEATVPGLLAHVLVKPVTDTPVLSISVSWRDPRTSAAIANAFASVFVERERQLVSRQADSALSYLEGQLPGAEERMRTTQDALSQYQQEVGITDLPTQTTNAISGLAALDTKAQAAQVDAAAAGAQLESIEQELASTPETIAGGTTTSSNPVAAGLEAKVADLRVQLSAARKQYTDDFPTVIALKAQLAEAVAGLRDQPRTVVAGTQTIANPTYQQLSQTAATLQAQIAAANSQKSVIDAQRAAAQPKLDALPAESRRITDLQRSEKSAEGVYDALQRKYQDAEISKTTAISDVAITQAADPGVYAVSPNVPFNILLGFVVGLVLAVSAVFFAEFFDDRFRSEEDVRENLGLPVLAAIPMLGDGRGRDDAWKVPLSNEAFHQLVASLRYSSNRPPRVIAFTSADQGDGKSTVAMNAAISLGLMKARVLVVDADLRRPTLHERTGVANDRGLSDVLVGMARFDDAVVPTSHAGVCVLPSGRTAPNPVGLLQSAEFDALIERARERFDFVVIDTPALRSIIDAVVLARKADGTVLVVSARSSEGRAVRGAIQRLRSVVDIDLIGVVLNGTKPNRRETATDSYLGTPVLPMPPEARA